MSRCIRICGAHCDSPTTCPFFRDTPEEVSATAGTKEILPAPHRFEHTLGESLSEIEKAKREHLYSFYNHHRNQRRH